MPEKKAIQRIVTLELHTYAAFCRWLRESENTTVSRLITESKEIQEQMLDRFLTSRKGSE